MDGLDTTAVSGAVEAMLAEREIAKVLTRYCRASDRCDAELMRSIYHEGAHEDHGDTFRGSAEDYIERVIPLLRERFLGTMHALQNMDIEVFGTSARTECYCVAYHVRRPSEGSDELVMDMFGCRYLDRFEWRPGPGWRIAHRIVVREWQLRQPMLAIADQAPGYLTGCRDRTDPVFLADLPKRPPLTNPAPAGA